MYDLNAMSLLLQEPESRLSQGARQLIFCCYQKLEMLQERGDPLFSLWRREMSFAYGELDALLSQRTKVDPRELADRYGFSPETLEIPRLVQSIQTCYSVLIKCITYRLAAPEGREAPLPRILSGQAFRELGIRNYCYEDWFFWIVKYWDRELEAACQGLLAELEPLDTLRSREELARALRGDSFRHLYETVIPRSLRHALGEYYTPDWLAEATITLGCREEELPFLRLTDPTCGAGTFLTRAMERMGPLRQYQPVGYDINALAVLTAKANCLGFLLSEGPLPRQVHLPVYHYDVLNTPFEEEGALVIDTNCDLVLRVPLELCRQRKFSAPWLLEALGESLEGFDRDNRLLLANILLNRIFGYFEPRADLVVGNPPWVNWEYLPLKYRAKSQHLWPEYGLFRARGRELSFSKEDISSLITYVAMDKFLREGGQLCFVLRQAMFQSSLNGVGFRRFRLENRGVDLRVVRVEDLGDVKPFAGVTSQCALVLLRRDEIHRFPVPYRCWRRKKGFRKAASAPNASLEAVLAQVEREEMMAWPADGQDPSSVWIHMPQELLAVTRRFLGTNPYKARTGLFTAGGNGVYWMTIHSAGEKGVLASNLVERAKRKAEPVTAELERTYLYPLVQGSDLSQWTVRSRSYILCPHTARTRMEPVPQEQLAREAPLTFGYLSRFRQMLDGRKGFSGWEKELQARHFHAILRVGEYTFAPYKVAWRYIAQSFVTAVITDTQDPFLGRKLAMPNEKIVYVGMDNGPEAYYLCGILSSSPVAYCVQCYMNPTSISAHVLDKLEIPGYDPGNPLHGQISRLCCQGHGTQDPQRRRALLEELDQAVAELYGLPREALDAIGKALAGRRGSRQEGEAAPAGQAMSGAGPLQ